MFDEARGIGQGHSNNDPNLEKLLTILGKSIEDDDKSKEGTKEMQTPRDQVQYMKMYIQQNIRNLVYLNPLMKILTHILA